MLATARVYRVTRESPALHESQTLAKPGISGSPENRGTPEGLTTYNHMAGEQSVSALAADYPMSFAAVQKHVAVLERAGLITKRRSGRESLASGDVEAVRAGGALLAELEAVWHGRVAGIDALVANDSTTPTA